MKNNRGFTLIELIVVSALVAVVLLGLINIQYYIMKNATINQGIESISLDSTKIKKTLADDIRNSSSPNNKTDPVNVVDLGKGLIIYTYKSNVYTQINYRVSPNNDTLLQRTYVHLPSGTPDPDVTLPAYGSISEDETLQTGVAGTWLNISNILEKNQSVLFTSKNSSFPSIKGITYSIKLKYPNEDVKTSHLQDTVFSRNPMYNPDD